jgi:3-oxoacyl-[acyl-carrier protein] reductase
MTQLVENKVVMVTGATRGIGLCITRALVSEGAFVIAHGRHCSEALRHLVNDYPNKIKFVSGDLTDPKSIESMWDESYQWQGKIDVLVNNAGAYIESPINDVAQWRSGWASNLQINLVAAAELCRLALLAFKAQKGGIIINMASRSSHRGDNPEFLAYGAAKGGLLALTKGIARGYGDSGVLAYALAPGWVRTDMAEDFISQVGEEEVTKNLPLREVTPPEDVAAMVCFLASGRCRHATGSTIDITGADYVR